ncbi:MAG: methyl-accepting chemotaxis protein [Lachnospiraceae bacterium]|nr:methyl-accepting chemotaxis protein [Lachnospiraceae bacterium]
MSGKKRSSLKKLLLSQVIIYAALMIVIITNVSVKLQVDKITGLSETILARESVSYAKEVNNWWAGIEERVKQSADVLRSIPDLSYEDALAMLLKLTELDPDSQDIYMAYGDTSVFLDGSGWVPDDTFEFTDRPWYQGALAKNGEIYTSEPYVDASTGKTCLACAVMVKDQVVLSSDINFDKVTGELNQFKSSSDKTSFYIINKESKDILVANNPELAGQTVSDSSDPVIQGLNKVFSSLNTQDSMDTNKVQTAKTSQGKMMYAATDIEGTSWVVVSAVPFTFVSDSIERNMFITFAISAVLLLLLAVLLYIIISKYTNPVTKVTERIGDISDGNFTVNLMPEGNNEITTLSESLNQYIVKMRDMLLGIADISGNMNNSARRCTDISRNLASSNQAQGGSIEKLNFTLNSMNSSIGEIANAATNLASTSADLQQKAENVKSLCMETMESSSSGKNEMASMTTNVNTLNATIRELTDIIHATARSVNEITGITDTISAISNQTNLLSLNASIEAARAGEMGKGFAVVASEVGALAQQSSEATENICKLIAGVTDNIEAINHKADICITDMEACLSGVDSVNKSFSLISDDLSKATDGIVEIADGIEMINDVAANNAATTEEQAASINQILSLSDQIVEESDKLLKETDSIASISEQLNNYSDDINSHLAQYTL